MKVIVPLTFDLPDDMTIPRVAPFNRLQSLALLDLFNSRPTPERTEAS